jgi:16S rRNA processing protein RimM
VPDLIPVARLVGVFGVRGEFKCKPTPAGEGTIEAGREYALSAGEGAAHVRCVAVRRHQARLLVTLEGITTPEAAQALVGRDLFAERAQLTLGPNEYLDGDLTGLQLIDPHGNALGTVTGVEHYPTQDCLVVGPKRALVPMVRAFIRKIDLTAGTIDVDLPEGLLD